MRKIAAFAVAFCITLAMVLIPIQADRSIETEAQSRTMTDDAYDLRSGLHGPDLKLTWYDMDHHGARRGFDMNSEKDEGRPIYFSVNRVSGTERFRAALMEKIYGQCTGFQVWIYSTNDAGEEKGAPWAAVEYVHVDSAWKIDSFDIAQFGTTLKELSTLLAVDKGPHGACGSTGPHLHQQVMEKYGRGLTSVRGGALISPDIRRVRASPADPENGKEDSCDHAMPITVEQPLMRLTFEAGAPDTAENERFPDRTLTVSKQGSGSIAVSPTPNAQGKYTDCTEVTLTANPGARFVRWDGAGFTDSSSPNVRTIWMSRDQKITAVFSPPLPPPDHSTTPYPTDCELTVEVSPRNSGSTTPAAGSTYTYDPCQPSVDLDARTGTGYRFDKWSGSGIDNISSSDTKVAMRAGVNKTVTAHFKKQCTLTVTSTTGGTTSENITADCGTEQTFSADETTGEGFGRWEGDVSSTSKSNTVTLNDDMSVHAVFECKLTVNFGPGGTASGGGLFDCGTDPGVTAMVTNGYRFRSWDGATPSTSSIASVTLNSNKTVKANFYCLLMVSSGLGGTAKGGGVYACGRTQLVTPAVTTGHSFRHWSGDLTGSANPGRVYLNKNKNVRANFDCRLTVRSTAGGMVRGGRTVECSTSTDLSIWGIPNAGHYFYRWYGSGVANVWDASTSVGMSRSRTVTADFDKYRWLDLSASPSSWGTVSGDGGYRYGARVTIRATAKVPASGYGYYFKHWKEKNRIVSTSATWTFRVYRDRDLIAVFGYICNTEFPCGYAQEEPP